MVKQEWRKQEKAIYLPKNAPEFLNLPSFNYFTIVGKGNPNEQAFSEAIGVLYSLSYWIKMLPKKGVLPKGYFDYSIYPLEGIWDLSEEAKQSNTFDKNEFVYKIMIRQPAFVTKELSEQAIEAMKNKKNHPLLHVVEFEAIEDGNSVQMLHTGSYDSEPESFKSMDEFCLANGFQRNSLTHREIYITDSRKTAPDKLKTVLRYSVNVI